MPAMIDIEGCDDIPDARKFCRSPWSRNDKECHLVRQSNLYRFTVLDYGPRLCQFECSPTPSVIRLEARWHGAPAELVLSWWIFDL